MNVPPLDTSLWGRWMAQRDEADGEGYYYSPMGMAGATGAAAADGVGGLDEDDDISSVAEAFRFENANGEVELGDMELGEMELEFREGDELEDKSHDPRLFDDNDGGRGVKA